MSHENILKWPSGDCKPVLATRKMPSELANAKGVTTFRSRDDLDWFEGAIFETDTLGTILIMRHDNSPAKLTAFYIDAGMEPTVAEKNLAQFFDLAESEIEWRLSRSDNV